MIWVIDASSVAAYLLGAGTEPEVEAVLGDVHAPALLDIEVAQTLRGLLRGSKIQLEVAETARAELRQLTVRRHLDAPLLRRCWELRETCTTYDALYVALAEALDATLVTRDARLARAVGAIIEVSCS